MKTIFSALIIAHFALIHPAIASADDKKSEKKAKQLTAKQKKQYAEFEKRMQGVKLVGKFTIVGQPTDKLAAEEYTIRSVKKLPEGDLWAFATQIKYGKLDLPITLNLPVKWAGDTPVITLTNLTIPTLGTFSARVVLYNKKYAGTWTHGKVGGHMFGVIVKMPGTDGAKKSSE